METGNQLLTFYNHYCQAQSIHDITDDELTVTIRQVLITERSRILKLLTDAVTRGH
jgi:hypothetical protein